MLKRPTLPLGYVTAFVAGLAVATFGAVLVAIVAGQLQSDRQPPAATFATPQRLLAEPAGDRKLPLATEIPVARAAPTNTIIGAVVSVADGDTLTVQQGQQNFVIRLQGIDSPEDSQPFGADATDQLVTLVAGSSIKVTWSEHDKYNRVLGHVYNGDRYVNLAMVEAGAAWHYKEYSSDAALAAAEKSARAQRVGLWKSDNPIPPWDYRHKPPLGLLASVPAPEPAPQPQAATPPIARATVPAAESVQPITVYVTRTGAKYHRAGCRHLAKSSIPIDLAEAKQRYSPCSVCRPP